MNRRFYLVRCYAIGVASICLLASTFAWGGTQTVAIDRDRGREMLKTIKADLKKYYYDPSFHGMDVETSFRVADDRIRSAASNGEIFGIIAQLLSGLNDSHTFFLAPDRVSRIDYGWRMQIIGDNCYVVAVKPGTDAAAKGLKRGDVIHTLDGFIPIRQNFWKFDYLYYRLSPRTGISVVVKDGNESFRQLNIASKLTEGKELAKQEDKAAKRERERKKAGTSVYYPRYYEAGTDLIVCKMPSFDLDDGDVDKIITTVRSYKSLIVDLRRNEGGFETALVRLAGYFFDRKMRIADVKERDKVKPLETLPRSDKTFSGRVIVLVDSGSASAAEVFARVMQLEKRGLVIGDQTAGAVMAARHFAHSYDRGVYTINISFYGASITIADLIMTDGKSLEHTGVIPDEVIVPSANDLQERRDPVLAHAASLLGVKLDPKSAGALFPLDIDTEVEMGTTQD